jgi:hypothetical protein
MRLNDSSATVMDTTVRAPSSAGQSPSTNSITDVYDPLAGTSKPFPWLWVGIGGAIAVWYFFLRKK